MSIKNLFFRKKAKKMQSPPLIGRIARSVSGRDKGTLYIITEQFDDIYVAVTDGKYRKVSDPKRKNVRHLLITELSVPDRYAVRGKIVITDGEAAAILSDIAKLTDT